MSRPPPLTYSKCEAVFDLPVAEAAIALGVSRPTISKVLRARGIERWPYRKLRAEGRLDEIRQRRERGQTPLTILPTPSQTPPSSPHPSCAGPATAFTPVAEHSAQPLVVAVWGRSPSPSSKSSHGLSPSTPRTQKAPLALESDSYVQTPKTPKTPTTPKTMNMPRAPQSPLTCRIPDESWPLHTLRSIDNFAPSAGLFVLPPASTPPATPGTTQLEDYPPPCPFTSPIWHCPESISPPSVPDQAGSVRPSLRGKERPGLLDLYPRVEGESGDSASTSHTVCTGGSADSVRRVAIGVPNWSRGIFSPDNKGDLAFRFLGMDDIAENSNSTERAGSSLSITESELYEAVGSQIGDGAPCSGGIIKEEGEIFL